MQLIKYVLPCIAIIAASVNSKPTQNLYKRGLTNCDNKAVQKCSVNIKTQTPIGLTVVPFKSTAGSHYASSNLQGWFQIYKNQNFALHGKVGDCLVTSTGGKNTAINNCLNELKVFYGDVFEKRYYLRKTELNNKVFLMVDAVDKNTTFSNTVRESYNLNTSSLYISFSNGVRISASIHATYPSIFVALNAMRTRSEASSFENGICISANFQTSSDIPTNSVAGGTIPNFPVKSDCFGSCQSKSNGETSPFENILNLNTNGKDNRLGWIYLSDISDTHRLLKRQTYCKYDDGSYQICTDKIYATTNNMYTLYEFQAGTIKQTTVSRTRNGFSAISTTTSDSFEFTGIANTLVYKINVNEDKKGLDAEIQVRADFPFWNQMGMCRSFPNVNTNFVADSNTYARIIQLTPSDLTSNDIQTMLPSEIKRDSSPVPSNLGWSWESNCMTQILVSGSPSDIGTGTAFVHNAGFCRAYLSSTGYYSPVENNFVYQP